MTKSIAHTTATEDRKPCREVAGWVNADGTRGFEMACGDTYDNIEATELEALRAGHVCGDEDEPAAPADETKPWPELQPGERVTLTVDARVGHAYNDDDEAFELDGHSPILYVPHNHPHVQITRAAPADGIPEVGELWTDRTGQAYFVVPGYDPSRSAIEPDLAGSAKGLLTWREVHRGPDGPIRRLMTVDEIASYR